MLGHIDITEDEFLNSRTGDTIFSFQCARTSCQQQLQLFHNNHLGKACHLIQKSRLFCSILMPWGLIKSDNNLVPSFDPSSSDYLPTPHSRTGSIVNTRRYIVTGEYLKIAQRKALRIWWKITGVPQKSLLPKTSREENAAKTDETVYEYF